MSLFGRKNQLNFLQIRPSQNPAAQQNSDNTAEAFNRLNTILKNVDGAVRFLDTGLRTVSVTVTDLEGDVAAGDVRLSTLEALPITSGSLTAPTALSGAPVAITHGLGRVPVGFFISDIDAHEVVFRTAWNSTTITVSNAPSTGSVNISLWVF